MIGFKKVPKRAVLVSFAVSIVLILMLYVDIETYESLPVEEIEFTEKFSTPLEQTKTYQMHEVQDGENLSIIFEKFSVPLNTAYKIFRLDSKNIIANIKPGEKMLFEYSGEELTRIEIMKDQINSISVSLTPEIVFKNISKSIELIEYYNSGIIQSSFYEAALDANIPESVIMDFAYIFGWDVDFVFDIREGDEFHVIYETPYSDGEKVKNGDIVIAKFINNGNTYFANRFFTETSKKQYFDENGNNMQKAFLRAPLDFAYISSHFNPNRMHPVLHTIRAHNGVDYAAKRGSPVRTTGDGIVSFSGQRNGCGNEIVINHTNEYSTRYCHLEKFSKGIRKGKKVTQGDTIGFVGSSGLATGPHLHYEFKIGEKRIDPIKVKLPSADPVPENLRVSFDTLLKNNKLSMEEFNKLSPSSNE
ncbi:peptidoglycan DD-metalloendopeptidase family protein [Gammaproteobacteria bacterium]|nr:peptidoglycan DD-metalloendopeptidase family protein [Gammaproteobacteria bacterium]MDA8998730.1 peptidoglycan DD-metalloendopeptidase family protein [Gammaproteobacteria bacterium]MDC3289210.1 peptidoglycan DD-metalloendopeptidase family protein [Gammaproteobacteria bacterium]